MPELPSPLIDILSAESFAAEHLPGSVNICVYETAFIDKIRAAFPDPNTALTVYGLNDSTLEAGVALTKLGTAGYMRVSTLPGGLEGWKASGGNVEQSAAPELPSGQFEVDQKASLVEWMGRNLFNRHAGGTTRTRTGPHKRRPAGRRALNRRYDQPPLLGYRGPSDERTFDRAFGKM
jgi:3-mercaptopyruvate sulfurtransferase SseA